MPARSRTPDELPLITLRELNRAALARQLLLKRARLDVVEAIDRLTPLQAQWSTSPYIALWSRVARFTIASLERALERRDVVKATLMRGTLHLVSRREYPLYAVLITRAREALWARYVERAGVDLERIRRRLHAFASEPRAYAELAALVERGRDAPWPDERYGGRPIVAAVGGLVHAPPSGSWRHWRSGKLVSARAWLGEHDRTDDHAAHVHAVRRYLGAFGPASLADVVAWSRVRPKPLRAALDELAPEVVPLRDERGRELYDLREAPRPAADVAAPVRFLPKWDQLLLAYDPRERVRVLPERYRPLVIGKNGDVVPTVLVDGFVAARWDARVERGTAIVTVEPYSPISRADRAAIEDEGIRLARFVHPEARSHRVRFGRTARTSRYNMGIRP